jgi:sugar phosphate isomerase/epimerase
MAERDWTRREWLWLAASTTVGGTAFLNGQTKRPWGVQLYTVRKLLGDRAGETLKAIAAIGYKEIELFERKDLSTLVPLARNVGLMPVCTHVEASLITGAAAAAEQPAAFDAIRKLGLTHVVLAYLTKDERPKDMAGWHRLAQQMNRAGEAAKAAGLTFGYHNHGFEFEKLPEGRRPLDVLIETSDPTLVKFELDVFWVGITGADPVALIEQLGKRVSLLHLKDKAKNTPVETDEAKVTPAAFAEVGSGTLDFPAILKAARTAGVEHYFAEQDETRGDPLASLEKSYAYLSGLS